MTDDIWTVRRILEWIEGYLSEHGDDKPRAAAQWLVGEALGVSRMQLFLDSERPLSADERTVLRDWTRRRATGEPLQYITGTVDFRHITVKVGPGVLIPRPETEVLVSEALALLPPAPKPQDALDDELVRQLQALEGAGVGESDGEEAAAGDATGRAAGRRDAASDDEPLLVADIGTGTGCIACSIAHEHPRAVVVATDVAPRAVELAGRNVADLGLGDRVTVLECDMGEGVDPDAIGRFHLVVSNPPYIPTAVLAELPDEVAGHEPVLALDGGPDGLGPFRRLLEWCRAALRPGGGFAFELHETCLDAAADEARAAGFADVRITRDLADRPRILTARRP